MCFATLTSTLLRYLMALKSLMTSRFFQVDAIKRSTMLPKAHISVELLTELNRAEFKLLYWDKILIPLLKPRPGAPSKMGQRTI